MKIWLDDVKEPIRPYVWAQTVDEAKGLIIACEKDGTPIEEIDLDYDLGEYGQYGGTGMKLLEWLHERGTHYPCDVHSTHIYGAQMMRSFINAHWR